MHSHSDIPMRNDTARHIKEVRKILRGSEPEILPPTLLEDEKHLYSAGMFGICLLLASLMFIASCIHSNLAHAHGEVIQRTRGYSGIPVELLANAIYKAENSTTYPYGVLTHYKHTTPRQACINTIAHRLRQWDGKGDFIVFLGERYSPLSDNPNWVRLVKYFLRRENV